MLQPDCPSLGWPLHISDLNISPLPSFVSYSLSYSWLCSSFPHGPSCSPQILQKQSSCFQSSPQTWLLLASVVHHLWRFRKRLLAVVLKEAGTEEKEDLKLLFCFSVQEMAEEDGSLVSGHTGGPQSPLTYRPKRHPTTGQILGYR